MFFKKNKEKSEQRGTLMVEAIAMLGLIAIVTPTLYKKSAERLQEIQDINVASQARTMTQIIESFVRSHTTAFRGLVMDDSAKIVELCSDSTCSDVKNPLASHLTIGYSSAIPYGFNPDEIKGFKKPRVFAVVEQGNVVFYVVYPKEQDLGKKRTARLASLIGANGGFVNDKASSEVLGTGGAWGLDSAMINEFKLPKEILTENSLVLTNNEPITTKLDDTDIYLYRVPGGDTVDEFYHNTMVTDLYMGGNSDGESSKYEEEAKDFQSIFNVRKLTLNTNCSAGYIYKGDSSGIGEFSCDPDVADLYVGKPVGMFTKAPQRASGVESGGEKYYSANSGAAWIYGNMAALSDRFKLFNTSYDNKYDRKGYDVLQFSRLDSSVSVWDGEDSSKVKLEILRATNEEDSAQVSMMNGLVRVVEKYDGEPGTPSAFLVGGSSLANNNSEGRLITAFYNGTGGEVHINSEHDNKGVTRINDYGGQVYINGSSSSDVGEVTAETFINQGGGILLAGKGGDWINAGGVEGSAHVDILQAHSSGTGTRRFSVGGEQVTNHMIFADSSVVSLRDGAIRTYTQTPTLGNLGGTGVLGASGYNGNTEKILEHGTVVASKYTDILGATYIGYQSQMNAVYEGNAGAASDFIRDNWHLGVAGSAWVDALLFADQAKFNSSSVKELHAGFSSFSESPRTAWLNVYNDGMIVRNRVAATDSTATTVRTGDTRFYAGSSDVYMGDSKGAMAHLNDGIAQLGYTKTLNSSAIPAMENYVGADSTSAFVVGEKLAQIYTSSKVINDSSVAVDIQKGAMLFQGHSWTDSTRTTHNYGQNRIQTHAGQFTLQTAEVKDSTGAVMTDTANAAMFYADASEIRTRYVDFAVQREKDYKDILRVRPNEAADSSNGEGNVRIDGSIHVTGNDVLHVAPNSSQAAGKDSGENRATFEIDPQFVRVMARANDSSFIAADSGQLALLEVNAFDIEGNSSSVNNGDVDPTTRASVYIRRGAIELEQSEGSSGTYAADEGFGYIKANRFVSNANVKSIPSKGTHADGTAYDKYMVNPAYTSVMHDIKLTTRGGARLSDILPDYVLKGVYNVGNDFDERTNQQLCWSSGQKAGSGCQNKDVTWAAPYIGKIPYASCPPGYRNLATLIPTSFQMAQAGNIVKASTVQDKHKNLLGTPSHGVNFYIKPGRQTGVLKALGADFKNKLETPRLTEVDKFDINIGVATGADFDPDVNRITRVQGWFWGYPASYNGSSLASSMKSESDNDAWIYSTTVGSSVVPEALYFQANTYLKTSLEPLEFEDGGWEARMGFLYDTKQYPGLGNGAGNDGIRLQNNAAGYNDHNNIPFDMPGDWVWNLFPVPTNSLEGHATVYCYFDRTEFQGEWSSLVDPIDQLNAYRDTSKDDGRKPTNYKERLNDPSLKYKDPW
ncbi:MAG: hypothetical protein NC218_06605 [Acetobacter sp.]|nr:hypothetical protein [Acetobacter sp.]